MKKIMNKNIQSSIFIISSFFIGCILGIMIMCFILPKESNINLTTKVKEVKDGVVSIESKTGSIVESTGSGFIYKKGLKKAYVLTNEHVIDGPQIEITNTKGETTEGTVLGKDKNLDIAVIEIDSKYAPKAVKIGNSNTVEIGEDIFVIGSPISKEYAGTVTRGILSGKNRTVPTNVGNDEGMLFDGLQFDASINPGSSGAPLFNRNGEVIGICIMKYIREEIEGMGFAIPIEKVKGKIQDLESGKEIETPELGITMVEVSNISELKNYQINVNQEIENGVVVLDIKENSNADQKLKKGDIIKKVDNITVTETSDIKKALSLHDKGDTMNIILIRNNKEKKVVITLK